MSTGDSGRPAFPYGLITEEVIEWRVSRLLNKMADAGAVFDGLELFQLIKDELWDVALESSHYERAGERI